MSFNARVHVRKVNALRVDSTKWSNIRVLTLDAIILSNACIFIPNDGLEQWKS